MANGFGSLGVLLISLAGIAALITSRSKNFSDAQLQSLSTLTLAAHLCGATVPHIGIPGIFPWADSKLLYKTAITQVQSSLDNQIWEQAYSEGQNIPIDQAVALALQALRE